MDRALRWIATAVSAYDVGAIIDEPAMESGWQIHRISFSEARARRSGRRGCPKPGLAASVDGRRAAPRYAPSERREQFLVVARRHSIAVRQPERAKRPREIA